ncbi:N66 matrix protein-like [Daktulosphaira vitifoliae]|uniref:N66 matrix protein-like n=1 Tax=Daktulosphaira vitifoliae TaxID=58002 RepID=UPI0021A9F265|nr:N66 matrix protein-like [Daktulosphaira vitifoliae]
MNFLSTVLIIVLVAQVFGNPQGTHYTDRGNQGNYNNGNSGSFQQRPQQQQRPEHNSGSGSYSNVGSSNNSGSLGSSEVTGIGYNQTGNGTDLDSRFGLFGGNHGSSGFTGLLQNLLNRPSSSGHHGSSNFFRPISNNWNGESSGQGGYGSNNNGYFGNNGYGNNRNEYENSEYNQGGYRNPSSPVREIASNMFSNRGTQTESQQNGGLFGSISSSSNPLMNVLSGVANFASGAFSNSDED